MLRGGAVTAGVVLLITLAGCKGAGKRMSAWAEERKAERERKTAADRAADRAEAEVLANRPILRPTGSGIPAGVYRLVDLTVEAEPFKQRQQPWDDPPADAPDLMIRVTVDGSRIAECEPAPNSLTGRCRLDLEVEIDHRTTITLDVVDNDRFGNDPVGAASLGEPGSWSLGSDLPMVQHARVKSASIVLLAVPTWWALYGWRVIGFGAGTALASLALYAFRRSLLAREPVVAVSLVTHTEPPVDHDPGARCAECDHQLAAGTTICAECGAPT
jgi:hypothetical protein